MKLRPSKAKEERAFVKAAGEKRLSGKLPKVAGPPQIGVAPGYGPRHAENVLEGEVFNPEKVLKLEGGSEAVNRFTPEELEQFPGWLRDIMRTTREYPRAEKAGEHQFDPGVVPVVPGSPAGQLMYDPRLSPKRDLSLMAARGTDTVPAMLTPREAVLNRNAAELAGRGKIERLNEAGNKLAAEGVDLAGGGKAMKTKPKVKGYQGGAGAVQYNRGAVNRQVPVPQGQAGGNPGAVQYNRGVGGPQQAGGYPVPQVPASFYPPGRALFQGGTSGVKDLTDIASLGGGGGRAYSDQPVQFSAPDISGILQKVAKQSGLSQSQIGDLLKAYQGMQAGYGQLGLGAGSAADMGSGAGAAYQGGISDIGYPPGAAPTAEYHADKGSNWVGPYDEDIMIPRYWTGTSDAGFF
jgi:hypothetical protein